jgi:hypothetical protein
MPLHDHTYKAPLKCKQNAKKANYFYFWQLEFEAIAKVIEQLVILLGFYATKTAKYCTMLLLHRFYRLYKLQGFVGVGLAL